MSNPTVYFTTVCPEFVTKTKTYQASHVLLYLQISTLW